MKNTINNTKKVFLMVALFATVIGYANEAPFYISKSETNKTVLTLVDVKVGNLFTIKDKKGLVLYEESISQNGTYQKGFDLTLLPDGKYFFEIDKDMEVTSIPFSVYFKEVTFKREKSETFFKPLTVVKKNRLFISKLSLDSKPMEIEVYYQGNTTTKADELIYSETISGTKKIERIYEIPDLTKGNFKIVYKIEDKQFVEFI